MVRSLFLRIAVLGASIAMLSSFAAESAEPVLGQDSRVYFAAIGELRNASLSELQDYYQQKFGLAIETLSPISIEDSALDAERQQAIAEELVALLKRQNPLLADDPKAVIIGITDKDMYIRAKQWRFAFSYRQARRFAVVSTARMHLPSFKEAVSVDQKDAGAFRSPNFQNRVKKMISKNIGMLYYGLPANNNPQSVLYQGIMGIDELDEVGEDF